MWQPEQSVPLLLCLSAKKSPSVAKVGPDGKRKETPENQKRAIAGIKILNCM